jgi:hypothetical protein
MQNAPFFESDGAKPAPLIDHPQHHAEPNQAAESIMAGYQLGTPGPRRATQPQGEGRAIAS